ncbi:MAG: orotate phosphoribosyltransferase [Candidatus Micrarchaeota archaeon]|nr:orotate phosphoribosyltransferase [Candidatus Micrarchaeota archaeon]
MQKYQQDFIELAAHAGALRFGSFTTKSGRQTPYFFNSGVFYTGELSRALARVLAEKINRTIKPENYDIVFGPAYKGIPLAVSVSMALAERGVNRPWCFNRKEAKGHGDAGMFVGAPVEEGCRVLLLDDVFTTGGAKEEAIAQLSSVANVRVAGVFILLDRQEKDAEGKNAIASFEARHGTKVHPVVNADDIFEHLSKNKVNGTLQVTPGIHAQYKEYKKKYGV